MSARSCCLIGLSLAACGDLQGFGGKATPLATIHVEATGDIDMVRQTGFPDENLRIALVWGTEWLPEPLCFLPPSTAELAATVAAGCRDPLSFTPVVVAQSVPVVPNESADIVLDSLPAGDLMFGDVTARVAYGSLVVFDDRDDTGSLELGTAHRLPGGGFDGEGDMPTNDIVYGASFVAMDETDQRLAYREGGFVETGFYPRHGCAAPPPAFSILGAGGFSIADAAAATLAGELPSEPPDSCTSEKPEDTTVDIPLRKTAEVREVACTQRRLDSSVRYRQPPVDDPTTDPMFGTRTYACTGIPQLGQDMGTSDIEQLVVAGLPQEPCKGLTHYTLVGCREGRLVCDAPLWDLRTNPPAWWPCPTQATP